MLRRGEAALARRKVGRTLTRARGNVKAAARLLNVDHNTVWRWIRVLALEEVLTEARGRTSPRVDAWSSWTKISPD